MIMGKLVKLGKFLGFALPKTQRARPSLPPSPGDPEFARQTKAAESILERYRNAFRELAK